MESDEHGRRSGPYFPGVAVKEAVKDIAFGSIAGMVSEIFEYPFDLAKVRLQAQLLHPSAPAQFHGPVDCLRRTWRDEGVRGLYRGLPVPIVGSMAETASLFLGYTSLQNLIHWFSSPRGFDSPKEQLTIPQLGLAGAGAGFVTSFILTPIELVKCKMQVQMVNYPVMPIARPVSSTLSSLAHAIHPQAPITLGATPIPNSCHPLSISRTPRSPINTLALPRLTITELSASSPASITTTIRSILHSHGVSGLWLGHTGTIIRETAGSAAWFVCKEAVASWLKRHRHRDSSGSPPDTRKLRRSPVHSEDVGLLPWESALSGAVAGGACALALYPADTVKSAIQTQEEASASLALSRRALSVSTLDAHRSESSSFIRTLLRIHALHGVRGLYAGCGMTVLRAVPSSGIVFVVYDGLCQWAVR